jgi:serine/threonine protein kinase
MRTPETFKNKYSQKTDVYSFGVLAFEVATNKVPHEGLIVTGHTPITSRSHRLISEK